MFETRPKTLACFTIVAAALHSSAAAAVVINDVDSRSVGRKSVELYNDGTSTVDLSGWSLEPAIQYSFSRGASIEPGAYLVINGEVGELGGGGAIRLSDAAHATQSTWQILTPTSTLSMPDTAQGGPGTSIQVSISASPADGINSVDMEIDYDYSVIHAVSASTTGIGSTAGFSTFANVNNPGIVYLSSFSNTVPLSGSGAFARILFQVVGTPGAASNLTIASANINEHGITAAIDNGRFTIVCGGASNGTPCSDGNGCTINESCQAGACTGGTPISAPTEVNGMAVGPDKASISWSPTSGAGPNVLYDVVRGTVSQLPAGGGAAETCLASGTSSTAASDPALPALQDSFWYLTRARNTCGTGTYGTAEANGVPTAPRNPTACP